MATITIAAAAVNNWQIGSDVELRIYALDSFTAADNSILPAGVPSEDKTASSNWYQAAACSVSGSVLSIPSVVLESSTDSLDNPAAHYAAYFYTLEGARIGPFGSFSKFSLPPNPTSTTWAAIAAEQTGIG